MGTQLFTKSEKIQSAVSLINDLDDAKFSLLLPRILQKIHLKEPTFTEEEEAKLELALSVDRSQLDLILETLTFIFQQVIYHLAKPAVLNQQLLQINISEDKASAIVQAWVSNARNVTDKFKKNLITSKQLHLQMSQSTLSKMKRPLGVLELVLNSDRGSEKLQMEFSHEELYSLYSQLADVNWQLHLQMSQSTLSKMKRPLGVLELVLNSDRGSEKLQMEFSHEELYSLYSQLEMIQSQLDALR